MADQLVLEKQKQAVEILNEKNIDMWLTFVRETGNLKDPMMDMIVGTGATWHSAFILTNTGESIAIIGSLEEANMKTVGTYNKIIPYLKSVREDLVKTIEKIDPKTIAINYSRNSSLADGLTHGVYLELIDLLKDAKPDILQNIIRTAVAVQPSDVIFQPRLVYFEQFLKS